MKKRKMKVTVLNSKAIKIVGTIFILFLCHRVSACNVAVFKGDSLKGKYDLNDPRNPNCPCHKYQEQAEKEYRKQQKEEKKIQERESKEQRRKDEIRKKAELGEGHHHRKLFRKHRIGGGKHGREKKQRKGWLCTIF